MSTFSSLLGFRDFTEALFAQTQALDDVQTLYPTYANTQQNKFADLEQSVSLLTAGAATPGIKIELPDAVELDADALGNIAPGSFPVVFAVVVTLFAVDIAADPRLVVTFDQQNLIGTETGPAEFTATGVVGLATKLLITVEFAGVVQGVWAVSVVVNKAEAPAVVTPEPAVPGVVISEAPASIDPTPAQSVSLTGASSSGFALVGSLQLAGGFTYNVAVNSNFTQSVASAVALPSNVEMYLALREGSAWTAVSAVEAGEPTSRFEQDYEPEFNPRRLAQVLYSEPGFINVAAAVVVPTGGATLGIFARLAYGSAVNFLSPAIIQPV